MSDAPHRNTTSFGALLRRYRQAAGLTQEQLAERAKMSARAVSDLERGLARRPRQETVQLLVEALELVGQDRIALTGARRAGDVLPVSAGELGHVSESAPKLVGRDRELAALERHLAGEGPPLLVFAGEPGIGKSRLLRQAARRAVAQGLQVLMDGCERRGGQEPFAPLLGAIKSCIASRPPAGLRADLHGCAWLVRMLPELAAGPIEPLPAWTLPPEQERRLLFESVGRFLANVAGPAGTLLVLDDLQWAGPDALDLLATLVRGSVQGTLRVVAAYRDTEARSGDPLSVLLADLSRADLTSRYPIGPLGVDDARQLLAALLTGVETVTPAVQDQLLQRAGGVPFFMISYARALDSTAPGGTGERIPWSLAQSVAQRVAALPEPAAEILAVAALIGRVVPHTLLLRVSGRQEEAVFATLEAAERARLLRVEGGAYQFAHDLIREVLEEDVGVARRAALHRRIAEALEQGVGDAPFEVPSYSFDRSSDRVQGRQAPGAPGEALEGLPRASLVEYYEQLAYHYAQAGVTEKAVDYQLKAGEKALRARSFEEARAYFERALAQLEGSPVGAARRDRTQTALLAMGQALRLLGNVADSERYLRRAIALARELKQPAPALIPLYFALGDALLHQGRYADMAQVGEEGLALLGEDTASPEAALMNHTIGMGFLCQGREEGWAFWRRNARLINTLDYSPVHGLLVLTSISVLMQDKDLAHAQELAHHLAAVAQQHQEHLALAAWAQWGQAFISSATGDLDGAVARLQAALPYFARGDTLGVPITWSWLADNYLDLGEVGRAAEYTERARASSLHEGITAWSANHARQLGAAALCAGEVDSAIEYLVAAMQSPGPAHVEAGVSLARAYLAAGRRAQAIHGFEEVLAVAPPVPALLSAFHRVPVLPNALSGIEEAAGSAERVRALVERRRREPGMAPFLPVTPCLDAAAVGPVPRKQVHEKFTAPLSPTWTWLDPFGYCSFVTEDELVLRAVNGRDLWRVNLSAPRLLRPAPSSDFAVQTLCGPASDDQPAIGGLLLWQNQEHYLVLERGHWGAADIAFRGCVANEDRYLGRGRLVSNRVWLRLERQGSRVCALCSADGQEWFTAGEIEFAAQDGEQVGVHAIGMIDRTIYRGAYPEGTAIRFESFGMWMTEAT